MYISFSEASYMPAKRPYYYSINNEKNFNIVSLGSCSYVGKFDIDCFDYGKYIPNVLIGNFCSLAGNIKFFIGHNHEYKNIVTTYPFDSAGLVQQICSYANVEKLNYFPHEERYDNHFQIILGNDVWIGNGATILGGVKIGSGAIIGANSVVAKNIPPYAIAVGNPARVIKYRFDAETIKKFMAVKWWNWDIKKIYDNVKTLYDVENFLSKFYTDVATAEISIPEKIKSALAQDYKIYQCVADFTAENSLLKRIVTGFCLSDYKKSLLVIWLDKNFTEKDLKNIAEVVQLFGTDAGEHILTLQEKISPQILKLATHFITTREFINIDCLDFLYDTKVKIISALDEKIFENESALNLNKLCIK